MKYICDNCSKYPCTDDEYKLMFRCPEYSPKPKPMTHYDLLISKTLEEMAEWLDLNSFVMLKGPRCKGCFSGECDLKECRQCYLDWLKEPVDEEVE